MSGEPPPTDWGDLEERFGGHHYDRQGKAITFRRWAELRSDPDYVLVADDVAGPYRVVTTWMGQATKLKLDMGERPEIFETYAIQRTDGETTRRAGYFTEAAALAGHERVVQAARAARLVLLGLAGVAVIVVSCVLGVAWAVLG